jgi:hypothetical protein
MPRTVFTIFSHKFFSQCIASSKCLIISFYTITMADFIEGSPFQIPSFQFPTNMCPTLFSCARSNSKEPNIRIILQGLSVNYFLSALYTWGTIVFPLKVLIPCEKCSWFKIVKMIFWKGWRSPIPLKPKIHCFLVGGTASYSFYFLLNLQLKWNFL